MTSQPLFSAIQSLLIIVFSVNIVTETKSIPIADLQHEIQHRNATARTSFFEDLTFNWVSVAATVFISIPWLGMF